METICPISRKVGMRPLPFKRWKARHRVMLAERFAAAFGSQFHEWADFAEKAYAAYLKSFRAREN